MKARKKREEWAEPLEKHGCAVGGGGLTAIASLREPILGGLRALYGRSRVGEFWIGLCPRC